LGERSLFDFLTQETALMKKNLLIFLSLVFVSTINGQTLFLKLGPSVSKLKADATPGACMVIDENTAIGFNAIVGLDYLNYKYFNLSSGLGIVQGVGNEVIATYESPYQIKDIPVKLNFLTINTTCKLKIPIKDVFEPYINAGPRIDYLLSSTHVGDLFTTNPGINKILYGALLGGGMIVRINKIELGLCCDYYLNFNKLVDHQEHDETVSVSTFTINAIIGFKL
jgi:hypothetical protein